MRRVSAVTVRSRARGPRRSPAGAAGFALLLVLAAAPVPAGSIRGRLSLARPSGEPRANVRDAVVWIEQVPEKTERRLSHVPFRWFWQRRKPPAIARIVERGRRYQPYVTVITTGSALLLCNRDLVWHGPFSVSPVYPFDFGKRPPGRVDTLRFERSGVVMLRCDIHPDMAAYVIVTPNHAYSRPDSNADWRLPELPAGRYVVHAWHPNHDELHRTVTVPSHGAVELSLHW